MARLDLYVLVNNGETHSHNFRKLLKLPLINLFFANDRSCSPPLKLTHVKLNQCKMGNKGNNKITELRTILDL
jgi:hypothetical protein